MNPGTDGDALLAAFQNATGIEDVNLAVDILSKANWDFEAALAAAASLLGEGSSAMMTGVPPYAHETGEFLQGFQADNSDSSAIGDQLTILPPSMIKVEKEDASYQSWRGGGWTVPVRTESYDSYPQVSDSSANLESDNLNKTEQRPDNHGTGTFLDSSLAYGDDSHTPFRHESDTNFPQVAATSGNISSDTYTAPVVQSGTLPEKSVVCDTKAGKSKTTEEAKKADAIPEGSSSNSKKRRLSSDLPPGPTSFPTRPLISVRKDILAPPRQPPPPPPSSPPTRSPHIIATIDLLDSDDEVEENIDPLSEESGSFTEDHDSLENSRYAALIPDGIDEEQDGVAFFIEAFKGRYGYNCPDFYLGTLESALSNACLRPVKDRKLLSVYIHNSASSLTDGFCSNVLCCESVLETLKDNFIVWAWDITHQSCRDMLLISVSQTLNTHIANIIKGLATNEFPIFLIITLAQGTPKLLETINGNSHVAELISSLTNAVNAFNEMKAMEVKEEGERAKRVQGRSLRKNRSR